VWQFLLEVFQMSNMQINSVLSQIKSLSSQIHGGREIGANALGGKELGVQQSSPGSFASLMKNGVDQVNNAQLKATDMATAFERGTPGVELSDVMLEMQKANVSFRGLTEVRNRFVSVYQEVMNMSI
jgi:flagellar hook-basal body complex protein FliE